MVRQEKLLRFVKLFIPSVIACEKQTSRASQCVIILRSSNHFVDRTSNLIFSYFDEGSIFDLDHGELAALLTTDNIVEVHWADGENVPTEADMAQYFEVLRDVHEEKLTGRADDQEVLELY